MVHQLWWPGEILAQNKAETQCHRNVCQEIWTLPNLLQVSLCWFPINKQVQQSNPHCWLHLTHTLLPFIHRAAELRHGQWSVPEFDCDGFVKKWVIHYTAPFFGWDALRAKLEFKWVAVEKDQEELILLRVKHSLCCMSFPGCMH